jgi:ribosomal protein S27AE
MAVNEDDVETVKGSLQPGETVEMTARQRRFGPGGSLFDPASIIVTNKRIMIVNRSTFSFRREYEFIPYGKIASVRLERGVTCSSLLIRVQGSSLESKPLREDIEEGFVDGLSNRDAQAISDRIERWRAKDEESRKVVSSYKQCPRCGVKNIIEASYCVSCGAEL